MIWLTLVVTIFTLAFLLFNSIVKRAKMYDKFAKYAIEKESISHGDKVNHTIVEIDKMRKLTIGISYTSIHSSVVESVDYIFSFDGDPVASSKLNKIGSSFTQVIEDFEEPYRKDIEKYMKEYIKAYEKELKDEVRLMKDKRNDIKSKYLKYMKNK